MKISVIAGDGIGPEVIGAALETLPEDFETVTLDVSAERYLRTGEVLTEDDIAVVRDSDALLFGAIGDPRVPDGILERGVILRLRKELDLYVNLRPLPELGVTFVRENTEGPYSGVGSREATEAREVSVNTTAAVERCVRYACELAATHSGRLTLVHKTNVFQYAGPLWRETAEKVATDYPGLELGYEHADACAYHLVVDPSRYDVIVTDNLFGDLLSDLGAGLGAGLGKAASANLHPEPSSRPTRCVGLFEPVHGSAPDIAGRGLADPGAAIEAARMMIEELTRSTDPNTPSEERQ